MTEPARALIADAGHIADCVGAAYAHYVPRMGKPPGPMLADYADVVSRHQVWLVRFYRAPRSGGGTAKSSTRPPPSSPKRAITAPARV